MQIIAFIVGSALVLLTTWLLNVWLSFFDNFGIAIFTWIGFCVLYAAIYDHIQGRKRKSVLAMTEPPQAPEHAN